jgi:hypothetical protein
MLKLRFGEQLTQPTMGLQETTRTTVIIMGSIRRPNPVQGDQSREEASPARQHCEQ